MTREAITVGFDAGDGFLARCRGRDITRFRCAGRRYVVIGHPDYVDHVLHRARLKYVKSNDYEPVRAAGINLLTDEGDSWATHRAALNPTFARRHLNEMVDLMIDPIEHVTAGLAAGATGSSSTCTRRWSRQRFASSRCACSQDFGPLVSRRRNATSRRCGSSPGRRSRTTSSTGTHPSRHHGDHPDPPHPPRRPLVARPRSVRSDPLLPGKRVGPSLRGECPHGGAAKDPAAIGVPSFRGRTTDLHRAEFRLDGDGADGGNNESAIHIRSAARLSGRARSHPDAAPQTRSAGHRTEKGYR